MRNLNILWLLGAIVPLASGCGGGAEAEAAPSVITVPVSRGDLLVAVEATGNVEPIRDVEVKSKASGEILRLLVDVGDEVRPGALLAEIDPRDVRNAYEQAEADRSVAVARMEISAAQLGRSEELVREGVITQQEFETRNLDNANAVAQLVRAETNFELAKLRLEDVLIRAPMAGTVIQRNVEEGTVIQSASQNVSGGTTLVVMADLNEMQVRTMVDETDMGRIQPGLPATVSVEAYPEREFRGVVLKIEPQAVVQQNVTMFPVIIRIENEGGVLKPGMNAEVVVQIDRATSVLTLPNNAIVKVQDAGPAMMVLGLDPEEFDLREMMREAFSGGGQAAREGDATGTGGAPQRGRGRSDLRDSLRARVARGEITQDSMRVLVRAAVAAAGAQSQGDELGRQRGGQRGGRGDGAGRGGGGFSGGGRGLGGGRGGDRGRPGGRSGGATSATAVVFVVSAEGVIEPRVIMTGLADWDNTQITRGLEEGEQIAVVGAAQLQASQQEFINRIRGRSNVFGGTRGRSR
jgi:HlyD family secretion protein